MRFAHRFAHICNENTSCLVNIKDFSADQSSRTIKQRNQDLNCKLLAHQTTRTRQTSRFPMKVLDKRRWNMLNNSGKSLTLCNGDFSGHSHSWLLPAKNNQCLQAVPEDLGRMWVERVMQQITVDMSGFLSPSWCRRMCSGWEGGGTYTRSSFLWRESKEGRISSLRS